MKSEFCRILKKIYNAFFIVFSTKIDVSIIILNHFNTLKSYKDSKYYKDFLTFFIYPLFISIFLVFVLNGRLNHQAIDTISIALSIFIPIMFSLLISIFSLNKNNIDSNRSYNIIIQFKDNVSFIILVSISLLVLISLYYINIFKFKVGLFSFLVIYLLLVIFLSLLMILKRWNYLLQKFLEELNPNE